MFTGCHRHWTRRQCIQPVLRRGEPVGQFAGVTLEAKFAKEFHLRQVVLHTCEEAMHTAHDGDVERILGQLHQHLIERGGGRVAAGIGQRGEIRQVPCLAAGTRTRLRQTKYLPAVLAEPGEGGGRREQRAQEGREATLWCGRRGGDNEVCEFTVARSRVPVNRVVNARSVDVWYWSDHPKAETP